MGDSILTQNKPEVSAAKNTSTKKANPIRVPIAMLSNTFGRAMNIKDGPAPNVAGSPPEKANTAGITIRADKNAIPVSKSSICVILFSRLSSLLRYDPYVTSIPMAIERE